jgi:hypothetical protein
MLKGNVTLKLIIFLCTQCVLIKKFKAKKKEKKTDYKTTHAFKQQQKNKNDIFL